MRRLFYCDHHEFPLPPGHKFPVPKYRLLRRRLEQFRVFEFQPAPEANPDDIVLAHNPDYVRSFLDGTIDPIRMRRIGFPWSEGLVHRTLASVGGTMQAAELALDSRWGGNLAGGTHHAFHDEGSGFCVFNDIAVSILALRARGRVRRAAVLDLDVHQGDGTAAIFESDPDVLTISLHGRNNFPFRKQQSRIDVALDDGTGDDAYLAALCGVLPALVEFTPEIVFYQAGVDALEADRLGRLALTLDGLARRDLLVIGTCRDERLPLVITLGGGYADQIDLTVQAHATTFLTACSTL